MSYIKKKNKQDLYQIFKDFLLLTLLKDRKAEANLTSTERNIRIDAINYDTFKKTWEQVKKVLGNKTLILTCLSLCSLFYVVTGVQVSVYRSSSAYFI